MDKTSGSGNTLRLGGVPEHFNLPWHLAMESDRLADLDLSWQDQLGGTGQMLAELEAGHLDLVSILTEGTIAAIERGAALSIVQVYVASPLQWGVFVPGQSSFHDEAGLAGARIAISRFNSGSHLMAYVHAQKFGWSITDEQFVVVGGLDGAIESFSGSHSDLFLWDQYMTRSLVQSGAFRQVGVLETPWPSFVFAARTETLMAQTAAVGRVVDAVVAKANELHSRDDRVELLMDRYPLDRDTVEGWLNSTRFAPRSAFDPLIHREVLSALRSAGIG